MNDPTCYVCNEPIKATDEATRYEGPMFGEEIWVHNACEALVASDDYDWDTRDYEGQGE